MHDALWAGDHRRQLALVRTSSNCERSMAAVLQTKRVGSELEDCAAQVEPAMSSGVAPCGSSRTETTTAISEPQLLHSHRQLISSLCPTAVAPAISGCAFRGPSNWRTADKITGQCLWNACKALIFGVVLLLIGSTMAIIGYYADSLSMMEDEKRGNVTIKVRNVSKQLHTLSYIGPIIMGVGGFVIVAACVMTFEARDSAAKIVPARFRGNKENQQSSRLVDGDESSALGGQELCVLAANGAASTHLVASGLGTSWKHRLNSGEAFDRLALTTAFIEFSQNIQKSIDSDREPERRRQQGGGGSCVLKQRCPSAPDLMPDQLIDSPSDIPAEELIGVHIYATDCRLVVSSRQEPNVKRLQVTLLPRQAISVDNPGEGRSSSSSGHFGGGMKSEGDKAASASSTDVSMTMDLHLPDCSVTLTVKDESKRSGEATSSASSAGSSQSSMSSASAVGTSPRMGARKESAKRHPLLRQRPVERHPDSDTEEEPDEGQVQGQGSAGAGGQAS